MTQPNNDQQRAKKIKCVVWDLDNTLWHGTLLEDPHVTLNGEAVATIKTLDERGILQSIASKNEPALALQTLREHGLEEYFLYPQIGWDAKSSALKRIAESINIGLDTLAFVDDQPFERDEVHFSLPEVLCLDAAELAAIPALPALNPKFITEDSRLRRQLYLNDIRRNQAEAEFVGPQEEFLASLQMVLQISPAQPEDLRRAEELTLRTNQLNATGYTYDYDELAHFAQSPAHRLWMARLADNYGSYGHIGLALVACDQELWTIKLLLMSCRVMARGVGSVLLSHIMQQAKRNHVRLQAEFVPNGRNRMMLVTYRFAGFAPCGENAHCQLFEHKLETVPCFPNYMTVQVSD